MGLYNSHWCCAMGCGGFLSTGLLSVGVYCLRACVCVDTVFYFVNGYALQICAVFFLLPRMTNTVVFNLIFCLSLRNVIHSWALNTQTNIPCIEISSCWNDFGCPFLWPMYYPAIVLGDVCYIILGIPVNRCPPWSWRLLILDLEAKPDSMLWRDCPRTYNYNWPCPRMPQCSKTF